MMGEIFKLMGTIGVDTSEAESGINKVVSKARNLGKTLDGIGSSMKKVGGNLTKGLTVPVTGAVVASIKAFADLEQAVGGVETLFKDSASAVIKNSETAYMRAGVSGTEYMEQITSFSASLLQGLGGDTVAAAKVADTAMVDMSDKQNIVRVKRIEPNQGCVYTNKTLVCANGENLRAVAYDNPVLSLFTRGKCNDYSL